MSIRLIVKLIHLNLRYLAEALIQSDTTWAARLSVLHWDTLAGQTAVVGLNV